MIVLYAVVYGQNLIIVRGAENFQADKVDEKIWLLNMDSEEYFIMQRNTVDSLTKKINIQKALINRHEKVLTSQDSLLRKYEAFETTANEHITTQKKLITTADSLLTGYKSLYTDLKRVIGLSSFALVPGIGLGYDTSEKNWKPLGSIGLGCQNYLVQYQIGKDYHGIWIGYRWSLGF